MASPQSLTSIALNGCILIRESHIDTLIRILYAHFPQVTQIGLQAMDFAVTSRAAKTTLMCHAKLIDSIALMHLLKRKESWDMRADSVYTSECCCGTFLAELKTRRGNFAVAYTDLITGVYPGQGVAEEVLDARYDALMTSTRVDRAIFDLLLDAFESSKFLNLAQGLAETRDTDISERHLPRRGPRITTDFGVRFGERPPSICWRAPILAKPWPQWGRLETDRLGICQAEILGHID